MNVFRGFDRSESLICQNPGLTSNLEKYRAPARLASVASVVGRGWFLRWTNSLSFVRSAHIRTFPSLFGVGAHHSDLLAIWLHWVSFVAIHVRFSSEWNRNLSWYCNRERSYFGGEFDVVLLVFNLICHGPMKRLGYFSLILSFVSMLLKALTRLSKFKPWAASLPKNWPFQDFDNKNFLTGCLTFVL